MNKKLFVVFLLASLIKLGNADEFDEVYAKQMFNFVAAAFVTPQTDNGISLAKLCFSKSFPFADWSDPLQATQAPCAGHLSDECQYMVTVSEKLKMVVIAFRGTVGKDQMDNGAGDSLQDYVGIPWGNIAQGKVIKYFLNATESVWSKDIEPTLKKYEGNIIAFTGHSVGGAMASLTALKARIMGYVDDNMMTLYTFGEPRIGDSDLASTFRIQITAMYRIIHNSDLVPHMPLCKIPGWSADNCNGDDSAKPYHHPQEIWYNNDNLNMLDGEYKACDYNNGEDPNCSNSISAAIFFANFISERGAKMHIEYYGHKLDDYGLRGCDMFSTALTSETTTSVTSSSETFTLTSPTTTTSETPPISLRFSNFAFGVLVLKFFLM